MLMLPQPRPRPLTALRCANPGLPEALPLRLVATAEAGLCTPQRLPHAQNVQRAP